MAEEAVGRGVLVVADRPPRAGLREDDRRLAQLLVGLRDLWPEIPTTLLAHGGAAHRGVEEELNARGIALVTAPENWDAWLALNADPVGFAVIVLHGPVAARRLGRSLDESQRGARRVVDVSALGGAEPRPGDVVTCLTEEQRTAVAESAIVLGAHAAPPPESPSFVERSGALLLASAMERPGAADEEAVLHVVHDVLPRVGRRLPSFRLRVVGEDLPPGIRALDGEGVEVVPEGADPREAARKAAVVLAPRRSGDPSIVPVLAAVEGVTPLLAGPLTAGAHGLPEALRAGSEAADLAAAIVRLCTSETAWEDARQQVTLLALASLHPTSYRSRLATAMARAGLPPPDPRAVRARLPVPPLEAGVLGPPRARRWRAGERPEAARRLALQFPDQVRTGQMRPTAGTDEARRYPTYDAWRRARMGDAGEERRARQEMAGFRHRPLVSVITPVYNTDPRVLDAAIASVRAQVYTPWELCLADDASTWPATRAVVDRAARDPRVRVRWRERNGGIVAASNDALALAHGEFVALLDHDDELDPLALFEVVRLLNQCPELDVVYTDEEKVDEHGVLRSPAFKPSFSPDLLDAGNYMCHLSVYRRTLLEAIGGFRRGLDGAQDLDLVHRVVERTDRIGHVAKSLYMWRMVSDSVATRQEAKPYAYPAGRRAIQDAMDRRGRRARVEELPQAGLYRVHDEIQGRPRVLVLMPAGDDPERLAEAVEDLCSRTAYENRRLLVLDGRALRLGPAPAAEVVNGAGQGLASLFNRAVAAAEDTDLVLLLGSEVRITAEEWMEPLIQHAQRPDVGATGALLIDAHRGAPRGERLRPADEDPEWPEHRYLSAIASSHLIVTRNVSALTSSCCMLRPAVIAEVGGMDERFRDPLLAVADLTLRIRLRGYDIVSTPYPRLAHIALGGGARADREEAGMFDDRWRTDGGGWPDPFQNPNYRAPWSLLHSG